ncbi:MAG: DUF1963 domain-containing protein [Desertifilum sp.]|nr:DUF1963 domain-containing protein [Desertifilum sp.]
METPQFLRELPAEFEPLRTLLETNLKPYIKIHETQVGRINQDSTGDPLTLWQSKIGGNPYFPKGLDYPRDPVSGEPMILFIQLNCAEVPQIKGFDLPKQGILQAYLGGIQYADAYADKRHSMLYFPEVSEDINDLVTDFSFINARETLRWDYDEICSLTFSVERNLFWSSRYGEDFNIPAELSELFAEFSEWIDEYLYENDSDKLGSKLAGHPDIHSTINEIEDAEEGRLLIELNPFESDDWLFWFILDEDLKKRNFSQVNFYHESD